MNDLQVKEFLRSVSARNPLDPIDTGALVERGHRGRRRRRLLAGSGAVAAVAGIVAAAALLPDLGTDRADQPVSSPSPSPIPSQRSSPSSGQSNGFVPLPGVPRGEAALGDPGTGLLTRQQAEARCRLRNPKIANPLPGGSTHVGLPIDYAPDRPGGPMVGTCIVPGDSRPSATTVAAAKADPVPASQAGMLRNCSVLMWHDLTEWRVVASERVPGRQANVLAMSPSGRFVAMCSLSVPAYLYTEQHPNTAEGTFLTRSFAQQRPDLLASAGVQTCAPALGPCVGWLYDSIGRVDPRITRIRLTAGNGKTHDLRVHDGWFALAWADGDPKGQPGGTVVAYDAKGNRIG